MSKQVCLVFSYKLEWLLILFTVLVVQPAKAQDIPKSDNWLSDREAQLPNTFKIPSYVSADATIFYKRDNWRVGLNFKNLFSTQYYDSQGYYLRPGAPLTVLGTISVQF
ncbi:hypothetical protein [Nostoc sp.]|uniref:hypothetical protein n=1 Tax=Nostoc sp. TaxID=1180 RepID=UPI002FF90B7C